MDEIRHLAKQIRDSGIFDSEWYLKEYPDVARLGIEPVEHYVRWGWKLGRAFREGVDGSRLPPDHAEGMPIANELLVLMRDRIELCRNGGRRSKSTSYASQSRTASDELDSPVTGLVDVIVPVFNALLDLQACLSSVLCHGKDRLGELLVINDGSDAETTQWLRTFCMRDKCRLIEHDGNKGYTRAINSGIKASNAEFVVTLNSDTVVTAGWLNGMVRCMHSSPEIGIVGPLSNAATWQNVPKLYGDDGQFAINELRDGMTPGDMASVVRAASIRLYPRSPFLNGFCMMIKREVIERIGFMDEDVFPVGYGEENDFCIRASNAGYELAVADDVYIFHAKSKSFGHERRKQLSANGSVALYEKHGREKVKKLIGLAKETKNLDFVRHRIDIRLSSRRPVSNQARSLRILFILPTSGGGGGSHSVVQEAAAMRRLGIDAMVAVESPRLRSFNAQYHTIPEVDDLFCAFDSATIAHIASGFDVVVATVFSSVKIVKRIVDLVGSILPAYYVQDYEPMFFEQGTIGFTEARESYGLIPGAVLFAKTKWIVNKVLSEHQIPTWRVTPSVDHSVYRPLPKPDNTLRVAAMIRPQTPRRGAARTMRVLERLADTYPDSVSFEIFGVSDADQAFQSLPRNFSFTNHGVLTREEVAAVLGRCHLFIDLSDYQAFGRTALEGMACGCVPVVPREGGANEFAIDGCNAIVVDTLDERDCYDRIADLMAKPDLLASLASRSIATASIYSLEGAASSEVRLFSDQHLVRERNRQGAAAKPPVYIIPSVRADGLYTGSAYVRTILPYGCEAVLSKRRVSAPSSVRALPTGARGVTALLQRDCNAMAFEHLKEWTTKWQSEGGAIIHELDDDLLDTEALSARGVQDSKGVSQRTKWIAEKSDLVVVSTQSLYKKLSFINEHVVVVPNRLDASVWSLRDGRDRKKRLTSNGDVIHIGYIGTPTHDEDLRLVADALKAIEHKYGDKVKVEVIGGFHRNAPLFGQKINLPQVTTYPHFVEWLKKRVHWDIGIIPLADSPFNESKSYLKFLEYTALDMAVIVSNVRSYAEVARDGDNALVVGNSSDEWYRGLCRMIDDRVLRSELTANAWADLMTKHTIDSAGDEYVNVLEAALTSAHRRKAR